MYKSLLPVLVALQLMAISFGLMMCVSGLLSTRWKCDSRHRQAAGSRCRRRTATPNEPPKWLLRPKLTAAAAVAVHLSLLLPLWVIWCAQI